MERSTPKTESDTKGSKKKPELHLSRPADKSLEAYKTWINEMYAAHGGQDGADLTDEEWKKAWKDFWD